MLRALFRALIGLAVLAGESGKRTPIGWGE